MSDIVLTDNVYDVVQKLKPEDIYAQLDTIGRSHMRPASDSEITMLTNSLKSVSSLASNPGSKIYAMAAALLANFYAFKREEVLDPVVERTIESIENLPIYEVTPFWSKLQVFSGPDWFGLPISQAASKYSRDERLRFGAAGIAFVDEYNNSMQQRAQSQSLIDAGAATRNDDAATVAASSVIMTMAPQIQSAALAVDKASTVDANGNVVLPSVSSSNMNTLVKVGVGIVALKFLLKVLK